MRGINGEQGDRTAVYFNKDGSVSFYRFLSDDKTSNIRFDNNGNLVSISINPVGLQPTLHSIGFDKDKNKFVHRFRGSFQNNELIGSGRTTENPIVMPYGLDLTDEEGKPLKIHLTRNGEIIDYIEIPTHINVEELKTNMYPPALIQDPENTDCILDNPAKEDAFYRIGGKWEVLKDLKRTMPDFDVTTNE